MQYIYENFTFPPDQSFTVRSAVLEMRRYTELKSHVNFEIALLENCCGKRFIGDHIAEFEGSELVLLGSHVPHCWQYYNSIEPMVQPQAIIIHFFPNFLGQQLLEKPEAKQLNALLEKASKGIRFTGATVGEARRLMQQMLFETGLSRAALMLRLLDILSRSPSAEILSSSFFNPAESSADTNKLNKVFGHIFTHFKEEIALQDVAGLLSMSTAAFCRFFKRSTNRTLIDFVKEIRIGHASRLLLEGRHNVAEACYDSGYNNLSNFNKHFKEVKGLSPRDFLRQYRISEPSAK